MEWRRRGRSAARVITDKELDKEVEKLIDRLIDNGLYIANGETNEDEEGRWGSRGFLRGHIYKYQILKKVTE